MAPIVEDVSFKTLDGLTLVGRLYPADKRGPGIIMTPGFNCVKEMFVPEVAERFQAEGITALIYDPRTLGESEGEPRNNVDPMMQVSDYSDAMTFMRSVSIVDPESIAFWGQSFAGTIALCAAALDKRAKLCISICPLLNFELTPEKFPRVLAKSMRDRESQISGNAAMYLPVLTEKGENPAGMGIGADKEEFDYMVNAKSRGAPNHENHTTLQTYYKIVMWQPHGIMKYMDPTPVLMVVPELDMISPPEEQFALFDTFPEPKKVHIAPGKGHLDVLSGEDFPALSAMQAAFLREQMALLKA
ncbi:DltD domain-containing protein [Penicillium canescens]|uniref:DltD domain-containing protein n=1 Tax=Penicillium canescens TaxID=5083 RepID=A0AAD6ICU9_PENCN|nr:DltD domain-containing protein [Penicillium canescens]KAJ6043507.1 DltD domain-containing protein [Penicillium canescens]KAJ6054982.1 DltD domain-containing protein [Penicillium canescens]